jgi:hypothetical protein
MSTATPLAVIEAISDEATALADADAFAKVLARNWEGGLLVARSAERQKNRFSGEISPLGKLSLREFAERAEVDHKTVARYLDAWNAAADDGLVPSAETLEPGALVDLSHLDAKSWDGYYKTGNSVAQRLVASDENEWYTPPEYIAAALRVLGGIDLDPASSAEANRTVGATVFLTEADQPFVRRWSGRVWLNPPYGGLAGSFVNRLVDEYYTGEVAAAIVLVNAHCTDTEWFQPLFNETLCFTDHRIDFVAPAGREKAGSSTHGSVFAYLGDNTDAFQREFAPFGAVVRRV